MKLPLLHCVKERSLVYCHLLLYACPVNLRGKQTIKHFMHASLDDCSFMKIRDHNSGCHRVWFTVELQVEPAPPDYTITLVSPTLSFTSIQLQVDSPHLEPLQLEVNYKLTCARIFLCLGRC